MTDDQLLQKLNVFFLNCKLLHYKKKALILNANDTASSIFYIKNGYVRVYRITDQGEELTLTILKPRDFFPLTYGIHTKNNPYFIEAITPLELWKAPVEQFIHFLKTNPDLYYALTNRILVRFDGFLTRMEYLVFSTAYIKVAATLLICGKSLGEEDDKDIIIKVPLTHKDIATLVGLTRETTSVEMKKLENKGLIGRIGRLLVLKNWKQFESKIFLSTQENSILPFAL